jgi:ribosomal protein L29
MGKKTNYKELTPEDLSNRIVELQTEWVAGKQKARLGQFKKTSEFSRLKKEIARAKTFMRQSEIASEAKK